MQTEYMSFQAFCDVVDLEIQDEFAAEDAEFEAYLADVELPWSECDVCGDPDPDKCSYCPL